MKRSILILAALIAIGTAGVQPAAAQNRYIVRTTGGLSSVLNLCSLLGCQVQGSLDGNINQTFLVTSSTNIVRLTDAQNGFAISGTGIVAVIDTGVDPSHPVLKPVLLTGYDFTRNQSGASEWLDLSSTGISATTSPNAQPVKVQQSSAAILDQSSAAILDGSPYVAFGHGTMTSGLVHLVAPKAKILPLKAFSSNGTGNLSNIVAALYYAVQNKANVVNMSFDLSYPSPALSRV